MGVLWPDTVGRTWVKNRPDEVITSRRSQRAFFFMDKSIPVRKEGVCLFVKVILLMCVYSKYRLSSDVYYGPLK